MKKVWFTYLLILFSLNAIISYAHPGKTDSSGGHYDRSTGEYHYHHGYPEHQHPNGICPYKDSVDSSTTLSETVLSSDYEVSTQPESLLPSLNKQEDNSQGYQLLSDRIDNDDPAFWEGYLAGYDEGQSVGHNTGYKTGYDEGYEAGSNQMPAAYLYDNTDSESSQIASTTNAIFISQPAIALLSLIALFVFICFRVYVSSLKRKLNNANSSIALAKQKVSEFEQKQNELINSNVQLRSENQRILSQLDKQTIISNTVPDVIPLYNGTLQELSTLRSDFDRLQDKYAATVNKNAELTQNLNLTKVLLSNARDELSSSNQPNIKIDADAILQENASLREKNHSLNKELETLKARQKEDPLYTYRDLMEDAGVPHGVTFDNYLLPHYFCNSTVEKNMHVYISSTGKCYHRKLWCSGASTPVHLFTVADRLAPCQKCIPSSAWNYKVPSWYYRYLKLLGRKSPYPGKPTNSSDIRYQLKEPTEDGINELKI